VPEPAAVMLLLGLAMLMGRLAPATPTRSA